MTVPQIIGQVRKAGFTFLLSDGNTSLKPMKDGAVLQPELLAKVKAMKPAIVAWLTKKQEDGEVCSKCNAAIYLHNGIIPSDVAACCRADRGEMNCPYEEKR